MAEPKTDCNSNETYTKSFEILWSITYSKSAEIKPLELPVLTLNDLERHNGRYFRYFTEFSGMLQLSIQPYRGLRLLS